MRLFVPYRPNRDRRAVAELCPQVNPLRRDGLFLRRSARGTPDQVADLIACFGAIYRVRLNGATVELSDLAFYRRPDNGMVGVVAYLPTESLPRGRNLLEIERRERNGDGSTGGGEPHTIRFWR